MTINKVHQSCEVSLSLKDVQVIISAMRLAEKQQETVQIGGNCFKGWRLEFQKELTRTFGFPFTCEE